MFGIVQGGVYPELRAQSAEASTSMDFHGYSVGGLAVGEGQNLMFETLASTTPLLPPTRPRYLMGVGTPSDIVGAVERGIDMFDCVMPTRSGRHGQAFIWAGKLNMRNAAHIEDARPRRNERLPGRARLLPGLYPSSPARGRVSRANDPQLGQHPFLPGVDGGHSPVHPRTQICRARGSYSASLSLNDGCRGGGAEELGA